MTRLRPKTRGIGEAKANIGAAVVVYNRYDLLPECLEKLYANYWKPAETLIVDNGRQLDPATIKKFPVRIITPEARIALAAAWNLIFREVPREQILLLNDDAFLSGGSVQLLSDAAQRPNSGAAAINGNWGAVLITRKLYELIGPFDENFWPAWHEDDDWRVRMRLADRRVIHVIDSQYRHIDHGTQLAMSPEEREQFNRWREEGREYYIRKWGDRPGHEIFMVPFNGANDGA